VRPGALRLCVAALAAACGAGCAGVSDATGAVAGLAAGAATANPAIGISVGIAARAVAREGIQHVARTRRRNEQDAIIAAAAQLAVGEVRPWAVDQAATGDAHGAVRVVRLIEPPLASCKELAFSVADGTDEPSTPVWFTTVACHDGMAWRWATAEPAVDRWRNLQ
jgi:hypothetical protein